MIIKLYKFWTGENSFSSMKCWQLSVKVSYVDFSFLQRLESSYIDAPIHSARWWTGFSVKKIFNLLKCYYHSHLNIVFAFLTFGGIFNVSRHILPPLSIFGWYMGVENFTLGGSKGYLLKSEFMYLNNLTKKKIYLICTALKEFIPRSSKFQSL